ncbi:MAG: ATP phosphoribosyltransferase regulatory subunit [Hyphomicrobiales bacterium]|nr:MAG: ATP phosphoribosyltransferase regulatory subunit [Hyphomicrobiales bacterium]
MRDFDECLATMRGLMETTGYRFVDPPILQPANTFVDLAGEDIRGRLFLTVTPDGDELCLRPEFTIPVCAHHIDTGNPARGAAYAYFGPVFRHRVSGGASEFLQAGVESIGREDNETADAEILSLALASLRTFGLELPDIRIGDQDLFYALVDKLDLPVAWRRRLKAACGDRARLDALIGQLAGDGEPSGADGRAGLLAALEGADHDGAHGLVEDLLSIASISVVGGRSASEIAERFLEQAAFAAGSGARPDEADVLARFLDIAGTPDRAVEQIAALCDEAGINLDTTIAVYERRITLMAERGIPFERMHFAADFGRRLDYYTGFVFEIRDPADPGRGPLVGGGRYNGLLKLLGAGKDVPAVGFSIWIERLPQEAGQ